MTKTNISPTIIPVAAHALHPCNICEVTATRLGAAFHMYTYSYGDIHKYRLRGRIRSTVGRTDVKKRWRRKIFLILSVISPTLRAALSFFN